MWMMFCAMFEIKILWLGFELRMVQPMAGVPTTNFNSYIDRGLNHTWGRNIIKYWEGCV